MTTTQILFGDEAVQYRPTRSADQSAMPSKSVLHTRLGPRPVHCKPGSCTKGSTVQHAMSRSRSREPSRCRKHPDRNDRSSLSTTELAIVEQSLCLLT